MTFSEYICERIVTQHDTGSLRNDPNAAVGEIKEFFIKWFKKFKVNIKTIRVDIIQYTRFGVEFVGQSKNAEEAQAKLRDKLPSSTFKGIDGRDFEFIRLQNAPKDYSIKISDGGSISGYFHIEPRNIKDFYKE